MIRLATLSDYENLLEYQKIEGRSFMPERAWKSSCQNQSILIAEDDVNQIQGFVKFNEEQNSIRILYLYSSQSLRRQGIGKKLLQAVLDKADQEAKSVSLSVSPGNFAAIDLYTEFDFVADSQAFIEPGLEELTKPMIRYARCTL